MENIRNQEEPTSQSYSGSPISASVLQHPIPAVTSQTHQKYVDIQPRPPASDHQLTNMSHGDSPGPGMGMLGFEQPEPSFNRAYNGETSGLQLPAATGPFPATDLLAPARSTRASNNDFRFSHTMIIILMRERKRNPKPEDARIKELARRFACDPKRVKNWFTTQRSTQARKTPPVDNLPDNLEWWTVAHGEDIARHPRSLTVASASGSSPGFAQANPTGPPYYSPAAAAQTYSTPYPVPPGGFDTTQPVHHTHHNVPSYISPYNALPHKDAVPLTPGAMTVAPASGTAGALPQAATNRLSSSSYPIPSATTEFASAANIDPCLMDSQTTNPYAALPNIDSSTGTPHAVVTASASGPAIIPGQATAVELRSRSSSAAPSTTPGPTFPNAEYTHEGRGDGFSTGPPSTPARSYVPPPQRRGVLWTTFLQ